MTSFLPKKDKKWNNMQQLPQVAAMVDSQKKAKIRKGEEIYNVK